MSIEENKELVRKYCSVDAEEIRQAPEAGEDPYHSPNIVVHGPFGDWNLKEYLQVMDSAVEAFPDLKYSVEDIIAEGDKVVCRYRETGTNKGSFQGMPPTGKQISVEGMGIFLVKDGKFVEIWYVWDTMGMMQQLGVIPQQ